MSPEDPPGFIVRTEAQKVAFERGFRLERGADGPWLRYASTTVPGEIWVAGAGPAGPWLLAIGHPGVAAEFGPATALPGPGSGRFAYATLGQLYDALDRVWRLARSLPTVPLAEFRQQVAGLPRTTEAERWTVRRVGQDIFRRALLDYWGGCCPLTGIADATLLRASHIVPWAACRDDAHRLDVHNGLLLSALWDAAFDAGLVSFTGEGTVLFAPHLSSTALTVLSDRKVLGIANLAVPHDVNLREHRARHGFLAENGPAMPR